MDIKNDAVALDFNFACAVYLKQIENKKDFQRLRIFKIQFKNALNEYFNNEADSLKDLAGEDAAPFEENEI